MNFRVLGCERVYQLSLVVLMLLPASCGNRVNTTALIGLYVAELPRGTEKLTLEKAGSFRQEISLDAGQHVYRAIGTWKFDPNDHYIVFDGHFLDALDKHGHLRKDIAPNSKAVYAFPVHEFLGTVTITASDYHRYLKPGK